MGTLWEDIKKTVKEGVTVAVEKTEEYGKIGKVKVDILKLERERDRAFKDLGNEMYTAIKKDKALAAAQSEKMKKMVSKIDTVIKNLKSKENEIKKIKKEAEKQNKKSVKPPAQTKTQAKPAAKKSQAKTTKAKPKA